MMLIISQMPSTGYDELAVDRRAIHLLGFLNRIALHEQDSPGADWDEHEQQSAA
jgi:hypothetical protein